MHLRQLTVIVLALMSSPAAAGDSDVIRLFSPVPSGPSFLKPAPLPEADQPPTPLARSAPAIRGTVHDGAVHDGTRAEAPLSSERAWTVALPGSAPAPFQPVR